jgi:hypothetical protein
MWVISALVAVVVLAWLVWGDLRDHGFIKDRSEADRQPERKPEGYWLQ